MWVVEYGGRKYMAPSNLPEANVLRIVEFGINQEMRRLGLPPVLVDLMQDHRLSTPILTVFDLILYHPEPYGPRGNQPGAGDPTTPQPAR